MSYVYTVNDHYERIASEIWEASRLGNHETLRTCITRLKNLKLTAETRVEYAKAALLGLSAQAEIRYTGTTYEESLANQAFAIADAMIAEEAKPR